MRKRIFSYILVASAAVLFALPAFAGRDLVLSVGQLVYVPVYSYVYQGPKNRPYNLSALLSIRNVDSRSSITVTLVDYYNNNGDKVRSFIDKPVVIPPMGTREVHIPERDTSGGSGANFTVKWEATEEVSAPVVQAVMIGTASTQGISFVCDGVVIDEDEE